MSKNKNTSTKHSWPKSDTAKFRKIIIMAGIKNNFLQIYNDKHKKGGTRRLKLSFLDPSPHNLPLKTQWVIQDLLKEAYGERFIMAYTIPIMYMCPNNKYRSLCVLLKS